MRLKLIIMNIIYLAVSVACAFILYTQPFINLNAGYLLSRDNLAMALGHEIADNIDLDSIIDSEGTQLEISLLIPGDKGIQCALNQDPLGYTKENIVKPSVAKFSKSLEGPLVNVSEKLTTAIHSVAIRAILIKQMLEYQPTIDANTYLTEVNQTKDSFDTFATTLGDTIYPGGTSFDDLIDEIVAKYNNIYTQVAANHVEFAAKAVTSEERTYLETEERNIFIQLGLLEGEMPTFKSSIAVVTAVLEFITGQRESFPIPTVQGEGPEPLLANREISESESEQVQGVLQNFVYNLLDHYAQTATIVIRVVGYIEIFMIGAWLLLGLFCIFKSIFKNPGIFFGLIFFLNFILQLILGLLLTFGIRYLPPLLGNVPVIGPTITGIFGAFTFNISTSILITALFSLGVFISSFIYKHWKKKRKEEI